MPGPVATEFGDVSGNGRSRLFRSGVMSAPSVAASAYRAMRAGDTMTIPGFLNKARIQIQRLGPRSVAVAVAAKLNQV